MDVRPIRNDDDLSWALAEVSRYFDQPPAPGTPDADRFDVLATLIEAYEDRHYPIPEVSALDVLHFAISDMGRSQSELAELLGSPSRASEILSGKRSLTPAMIRTISEAWHIPAAALLPSASRSPKAA